MSTTTKRAQRAQYKNMTVAEILRNMPDAELRRNARRGGIAAIAEQARRQQQARMGGASFGAPIMPDPELDIGV